MLPTFVRPALPTRVSALLLFLFVPGAAGAAEPRERLLEESWASVSVDDVRAGYCHFTVHEWATDAGKFRRRTEDLRLRFRQLDKVVELGMEAGTEEAASGEVTAVFMRQYQGKDRRLDLRGSVRGKELHVQVRGAVSIDRRRPWDARAVARGGVTRLFRERRIKPKDRWSFTQFDGTVNSVLTMQVAAQDREEISIRGTRASLLRIDVIPDKIQSIQLPTTTYWIDKEFRPRRWQTEITGLGTLTYVPASAEEAQKQDKDPPDLQQRQRIHLNVRIERPHETKRVVYRITRKKGGRDDLSALFAIDARQSFAGIEKDAFELRVKKVEVAEPDTVRKKPGGEYLANCHFIKWEDDAVRKHAATSVGEEKDPWQQALRIESWVHKNMEVTPGGGFFATADQVARSLKGNVAEHAFLVAAMARAQGIPSRVALGLIYDEVDETPTMRYHMWTEVWINNEWHPLDATLGKGGIGAGHLKISDHSWDNVKSLSPLLPLSRVWRNVEIRISKVEYGAK